MVRGKCGESKGSVPRCLEQLVKRMRVLEVVKVFQFLVYFRRK